MGLIYGLDILEHLLPRCGSHNKEKNSRSNSELTSYKSKNSIDLFHLAFQVSSSAI